MLYWVIGSIVVVVGVVWLWRRIGKVLEDLRP